jgi:nitrogen fixation protein NifU and related proteins
MSLRDLYQEIILDHGKTPRNVGQLPEATHRHAGHNPLCGDQLLLFVTTQNDQVIDARFEGKGCAISVASASLMIDAIKGKTLAQIEKLFQDFHHLVTTGQSVTCDLGKLMAFGGVAEFPIRVKCATLAWHTLKAALAGDLHPTSTE